MAFALEGVRVVELGHGIAGPFAARLLGDLGADVIKVEPPEGEFGRGLGPLTAGSGPDPRRGTSLLFDMLNWNKRGLSLDLRDSGSEGVLRSLVETADIVIDSFRPGTLERWGFGPDVLLAWNPRLALTSITNFGQSGPRASWRGSDLVFYAMSGIMHMSGKKWPHEPVKHGLRQALYGAGLNGAYASLAAYYAALRTGRGTHVDLSIQEVVASEQITPLSYYIFTGLIPGRLPPVEDPFGGDPIDMPGGQVSIQAPPACPMSRWAEFLGLPELNRPEYARTVQRVKYAAEVRAMVEARLAGLTAKDLFLRGSREGMILALVQDAAALLECEQLAERGLFRPLPGREGCGVRVPAELTRLSRTPVSIRRPAPGIGEHDEEVLAELAAAPPAGESATRAVPAGIGDQAAAGPLAGLRVLDLSNVVAGPYMGGLLADLGADVIKVEGPGRVDPARVTWGPLIDNDGRGEPWNRGGAFQVLNRGKRSFVCDLATREGRALLTDLIAISDILIENFTPRVMRNWGLTPDRLAAINPRLISIANSGYGATGPWQNFKAQGTTLEAMMGISAYTGYADGGPMKAGQSYPDFIACWTGLVALMAALIDRERTGLGQSIDQGMYQIGAALVPEAIIAVQADGADPGRRGAEDFDASLSGVFESAGHDEWVAVSVRRLAELQALARDTADDPAPFILGMGDDVAAARAGLAAWVRRSEADVAAERLQQCGIAAGEVMSIADLVADRHLLERGFYEAVNFSDGEPRPLIGRPYRFGRLHARVRGRAPRFGEHNREILTELGVPADRIADLHERGLIATEPVRPGGAVPVDFSLLTGPAGNFSSVHRDYLDRLRERQRQADKLAAAGRTGGAGVGLENAPQMYRPEPSRDSLGHSERGNNGATLARPGQSGDIAPAAAPGTDRRSASAAGGSPDLGSDRGGRVQAG